MSFYSIYRQGFVRVAACTPKCEVGDPSCNLAETLAVARDGARQGVALIVFPELSAWPPEYPYDRRRASDLATIKSWMEVFLYRFYTISQFKRPASPNGPTVSAGGSLSPRSNWRAPSDDNARRWLEELRAKLRQAEPTDRSAAALNSVTAKEIEP